MNIVGKLRRLDTDCSKFYSIIKHLNKDGVSELADLKIKFDYPKPSSLIKELAGGATFFNRDAVVLDFFAGSGTTMHATMELNKKDNGHRQCILITNNENKICEEVTYERNKKAITGYTYLKGEFVEGLNSNNLRYYKTDFISRRRTIKNMRALVTASTDLLCIKNNIYVEQDNIFGRKLKPEAARFFDDGITKMLVIYNEQGVDSFAKIIRENKVDGRILIYVFSNNRYAYTDNFEEVLDKVELCALPSAIYDAYSAVLKPLNNEYDSNNVIEENELHPTDEQGTLNFNEEGGEL